MALIDTMRRALGETFGFYFKAHSYHWNVTGPQFVSLHSLFGDIYADAHGAGDAIAEHIRTLDEMAPASLKEMTRLGSIDGDTIPDAMAMVKELGTDNEAVIAALDAAQKAALKDGNAGLQDFLQGRLDKHADWGWRLAATAQMRRR